MTDTSPRRFPPPWRTDKIPAGWIVLDATGAKLVYVYGVAPRSQMSKSGSLNEAQVEVVAAAIAALPDILRGDGKLPDMTNPRTGS